MKKIEDHVNAIVPTRPIFEIVKDSTPWHGPGFKVRQLFEHKMPENVDHDPWIDYANRVYQENFNPKDGVFVPNVQYTVDSVKSAMISKICYFLEKALPHARPTSTKIYQWWTRKANHITDPAFLKALPGIATYVSSHEDNASSKENKHVKNILGILEILYNKHKDKDN